MLLRLTSMLTAVLLALTWQSAGAAAAPATTVVFVGGYGSTLASATRDFADIRAALQARRASLAFVQFSYNGWNAQSCTPFDYQGADTGQDFETSKRLLIGTLGLLESNCGAQHILVIGHSLGGLIALHALSETPVHGVSDVVMLDSPLGGAPPAEMDACIEAGFCVDGPVTDELAKLNAAWDQTAQDNAARVGALAQAGIRATAWGNQSDCLYAPAVCVPFARTFLGNYDARETQWLGVDRAMRRDYPVPSSLAAALRSHKALLSSAALDIAADLLA